MQIKYMGTIRNPQQVSVKLLPSFRLRQKQKVSFDIISPNRSRYTLIWRCLDCDCRSVDNYCPEILRLKMR